MVYKINLQRQAYIQAMGHDDLINNIIMPTHYKSASSLLRHSDLFYVYHLVQSFQQEFADTMAQ